MKPELNKYTNVIFLDFDGVINHELFYEERYKHLTRYDGIPFYRTVKKHLRKLVKANKISKLEYYKGEADLSKIQLLNNLCDETNSAIVLSASMRSQYCVEDLQEIYNYLGATFTIIDKTGHCACRNRGCEIKKWLVDNCMDWFGVNNYDFYRYAIIDDDGDMLLEQQHHFFHVDKYAGLTSNHCYRIKRFFTHKTF